MRHKIILTGLLIPLAGCSALNTLFDESRVFVNERNSEVGRNIAKVLKSEKYYAYWEGNRNNPNFGKKYKIIPIENEQIEYRFNLGSCEWALIVESATQTVKSWRYIQETPDCKYKRFHEGPF